MPDNLFIPSVDLRIGALEEYNRTQKEKAVRHRQRPKPRPCITLSRQYGCQGYPVAERVCELMGERTGEPWLLIDQAVLDEVAQRHNISKEILEGLGEKNRMLDDILATFSPRWVHSHDCFQLLCSHVVSLAAQGNVVIMELGGAIITRQFEHAHHFRLYGSQQFKTRTIAQRLKLAEEDAEALVLKQQRKRDDFVRSFLHCNDHDPLLYAMLFNNGLLATEQIAESIAQLVLQTLH